MCNKKEIYLGVNFSYILGRLWVAPGRQTKVVFALEWAHFLDFRAFQHKLPLGVPKTLILGASGGVQLGSENGQVGSKRGICGL